VKRSAYWIAAARILRGLKRVVSELLINSSPRRDWLRNCGIINWLRDCHRQPQIIG
jgi:hypothetical protein